MTMDVHQLQAKLREHQSAMFQQGFLDDQFSQLQKLQDESTPDFVLEVVTMFFDDSENLLKNMARCLEQVPADFKQIDAYAHQYKGSSASVGAARVKSVCATFRTFCETKNLDGCMRCLQQLQQEYSLLKNSLQYLFRLQKDIKASGGSFS
ncbi:hypothetical protein PHAVU_007G167900 [Phaseolus vulgaris]|uniref:Histidine-containing phosphotransfer protein n=1 Tax=Phaseolus vulgaris TaxID=3885 RepID=V7BJ51_PHAVU|nr:hypothetical protein PHAVU_007G167900g [Phaseolus vulgaris]ESW16576.1 hypothetical protein PHAVU_007G167900g [Phaseolus vulgaris]